MNKKAFEMAISTLIVIILGILVLVAIIIAVTGGFDRFNNTTSTLVDSQEVLAIKQSCITSCENNIKLTYCCNENEYEGTIIKCTDPRLEVDCPSITCESDFCEEPIN